MKNFFTPFLQFFVLWTEAPDEPEAKISFSERIHKLRAFFRLCALDMALNTYQGTILREFVVQLNKLNQAAYKLIEAGQSALPIVSQFYALFPQYTLVTLFICFITYKSRTWRTKEFYGVINLVKITLFGSRKDHFTNDRVMPSIQDDRKFDRNLMNIPKSYFNLTQNLILGPFEIMMYIGILGPYILGAMAVLGVINGYFMKHLAKQNKVCENKQNITQSALNESHNAEHIDRLANHLENYETGKDLEMQMDLVNRGTMAAFMLILTLICSQLLFMGLYDMAMVAAQTAVGIQAFARISNYLQLINHHTKFENLMSHKADAINIIRPGKLDKLLNTLPSYQKEGNSFYWSSSHRILLYSAIIITVLGFGTIPFAYYYSILHTYVSYVTAQQWLGAMITLGLTASFSIINIETKDIDSTALSFTLQACLLTLAGVTLFNSWPLIFPSIVEMTMQTRAIYLIFSTLPTYLFDQYLRTKFLFVFDQIGTWLSQETFSLCKIPAQSLVFSYNKIADAASFASRKASDSFSMLSGLITP